MPHRVCPVILGYFLLSPLRKLLQDPDVILAPYVIPGMKLVDAGSAMGFFTLPLARLSGPEGKVTAVDFQEGMLKVLQRRAQKAGLRDRIETRLCSQESLKLDDLRGQIDFALAFAVVHEVPDPARFFGELAAALRSGGKLLLAEPRGHVSKDEFDRTLAAASSQGLRATEAPQIRLCLAALLQKGEAGHAD